MVVGTFESISHHHFEAARFSSVGFLFVMMDETHQRGGYGVTVPKGKSVA